MLDVQRLRVLRAVVASGTVQSAADHLGYTPSAVSQQIGVLQRETGLALFEKSGRGIAPTAAGRLLADQSDEVIASLGRLGGLVDDLKAGRTGDLTIGTFSSAGEHWVPQVARRLAADFPDVRLSVDLNEAPLGSPTSYDIDVRTEALDDSPHAEPGLRRIDLGTDPYVVAVSERNPLAAGDSVRAGDLAGERWIDDDLRESTCSRIRADAWRSAGFSPRYSARAADHHAALALVAAGVGICVLPRLAARTPPPGVRTLTLSDPEVRRRIVVLVREASEGNPAVTAAVDELVLAAGH